MALRRLLFLFLLPACGSSAQLSPTELAPTLQASVLTPSGRVEVFPYRYGAVLPWHVRTAEASWERVAPCVGVDPNSIRRFPVMLLESGGAACGDPKLAGCLHFRGPERDRIEILGASWDFDPARPDANPGPTAEIEKLWRHEFVHLALGLRDGDVDGAHARPEWRCEP